MKSNQTQFTSSIFKYLLTKSFFVFLIIIFNQVNLKAEVLFEGYYKVSQFKKHIGFLILKHELDAKTKQFKTTSFTRLAKNGFDMTESYQAVSGSQLEPISLSYLAASDKTATKTIDVTFKKDKMTGTVVENGKTLKINEKIKKNVILSSALYYFMLNRKEGLKTDTNFSFSAITEEGPATHSGTVKIDKKMVTQGSQQLFKVKVKFVGPDYENLISTQGEVISASTSATGIETELVKSTDEALEGIKLAAGTLEKIFGEVPTGKVNIYQPKK